MDDSPLCSPEDIKKYMSLIGSYQWLITLGRFDIQTATMTMSRFSAAPREGHLKRLKRIAGYIKLTRDYGLRVRTHLPDYSDIPRMEHDWEHSVYAGAKEEAQTMPRNLSVNLSSRHPTLTPILNTAKSLDELSQEFSS